MRRPGVEPKRARPSGSSQPCLIFSSIHPDGRFDPGVSDGNFGERSVKSLKSKQQVQEVNGQIAKAPVIQRIIYANGFHCQENGT